MRHIITLSFFLILLLGFQACDDQEFTTAGEDKLAFSKDTLMFDTVFTTIGSATRFFTIKNDHDQWINISSVTLRSGPSSFFRLNVDGVSSSTVTNVPIPPNDSIYVFAEVTIDPDLPLSISPYVISDAVVFETNGNSQEVKLEAWGQNANYLPNSSNNGRIALLTCDLNQVEFTDPKPYVVYGLLVIDSCELVMPAGTQIFIHGGLVNDPNIGSFNDGIILFLDHGSIRTDGTQEEPVVFQTDRLEHEFDQVSGAWTGIRFLEGSKGNFVHTTIKNSIVGIYADSSSTVTIDKTKIFHTSGPGIIGSHADMTVTNSLIYDNGGGGVQLVYGGNYDFSFTTIANFGFNAEALSMNNVLCLDQLCSSFRENALVARFTNCIVSGSMSDELNFFDSTGGDDDSAFDYNFDHCIVRIDDLTDQIGFQDFMDHCTNCVTASNNDILFENVDAFDHRLDTMSIAEQKGKPIAGILDDIVSTPRDPALPDIGCYEFQ